MKSARELFEELDWYLDNVIRKNGICQWTIRKYGREVMPNE